MKTKIIGSVDILTNKFTKFGRERNNLIHELEEIGYRQFRERVLKDKSRVLLAYKPGKDLAGCAFRLYPDLAMEQKTYSKKHFLLPNNPTEISISKIFANNKGEATKEIHKKIRTDNKGLLLNYEYTMDDLENSILIKKKFSIDGFREFVLGLKNFNEFYTKEIGNNRKYSFYRHTDGTKTYIKNINGEEYIFRSK
ncbi:MAG: hypothetical protein E7Z92_01820 [Cyanobacteria bacterium SIG31]|nr:hypothetical protein [Cyanobacteria bacterium SIG31]